MAELPPIVAKLEVSQIEIDGYPHSFEGASIHRYEPSQSEDDHVYFIASDLEPPPPSLGKQMRIHYPRTEHDGAICLSLNIVTFLMFGAHTLFKCEAEDPEFETCLMRLKVRPILELQEAVDD